MKIAIVCGHFIPSMGYIEVHLADAFSKLNHKVTVITTDVIPNYVSKIGAIKDDMVSYDIIRLKASFSAGQMVKSKKIINTIEKINPEVVVTIGVGKLFPMPIYQLKDKNFKLITLLGDNAENHFSSGKVIQHIKNTLLIHLIKKRVYHKAIESTDLLVPYSPSTISFISTFINNKWHAILKKKNHQISFVFNQDDFYFDEEERKVQRDQLGIISNDNLLITATRVVPEKKLEKIVDWVDTLNNNNINVNYLIIGFQEDGYTKQLKRYIAAKKHHKKIICKPFSTINQTRKYYNAADIAIFTRRTISFVEALATGLYLLMPNQKNLTNSLNGENGVYFETLTKEVIELAIKKSKKDRKRRAEDTEQFSSIKVANKLLNSVNSG